MRLVQLFVACLAVVAFSGAVGSARAQENTTLGCDVVGIATNAQQVVGGVDAAPGEFPNQVSLIRLVDGSCVHFCGGSLIAPDWVLTAAHCIAIPDEAGGPTTPENTVVLAGTNSLLEGGERVPIARIIVHERFSDAIHHGDDIALVQLARPVASVTAFAHYPASAASEVPGASTIVTGWGLTDPGAGVVPAILQKAALPIVTQEACAQSYSEGALVGPGQICAGFDRGGVSSCSGDSGGPVLAGGAADTLVQIGIVSWGATDCAAGRAYGVYTRVSAYARWIDHYVRGTDEAVAPGTGIDVAMAPGPIVKVGAFVHFEARVGLAGYLSIFDIAPDGSVSAIYPSAFDRGGALLPAGSTIKVPESGGIRGVPPAGAGLVVAIVTVVPLATEGRAQLLADSVRSAARALEPTAETQDQRDMASAALLTTLETALGKRGADWDAAILEYRTVE